MRAAGPHRRTSGRLRARRRHKTCRNEPLIVPSPLRCVWVKARSADGELDIAAQGLGGMGEWGTGPGVEQEIFPAEEYRKHARCGDYTRSVIVSSRSS